MTSTSAKWAGNSQRGNGELTFCTKRRCAGVIIAPPVAAPFEAGLIELDALEERPQRCLADTGIESFLRSMLHPCFPFRANMVVGCEQLLPQHVFTLLQ
jgi:hypothetical protein